MTGRRVLAAMTVAVAVAGCGGGGPSRSDAMAAVGADAAVPALQAFARAGDAMAASVDGACAAPSVTTVGSALAAVDEARERWLVTHAVWTGPVMERRAAGAVDWPVDAGAVEVLVTGAAPGELTAEVIAEEVGSDTRGLRALRGVLARDDAVALLADERWCDYVTAVAAVIADTGDVMVGDWTESFDDGPPFAEVVADSEAAQEWLSMLVNDDIQLVRRVSAEAGAERDSASPDPAADRAAQLRGVVAVTSALGPLLGDELESRLDDELDAAIAAFDAGDADAGRSLAMEVDRTLTTDVAARLGVVIGFSDADGDGSG